MIWFIVITINNIIDLHHKLPNLRTSMLEAPKFGLEWRTRTTMMGSVITVMHWSPTSYGDAILSIEAHFCPLSIPLKMKLRKKNPAYQTCLISKVSN